MAEHATPPSLSASRHAAAVARAARVLFAVGAVAALSGCLPTLDVNVATPEPIKVDLSMDVNVYQHGRVDEKTAEVQASYRAAMDARRNRMAEIQELKNNRLVGEDRRGLLSIRNRPAGEYGDYVERTVDEENRDREFLMQHEANEKGVSIDQVRTEQWRHWQRKSFPGEWIEVATESGGFRWERKRSADDDGEES